MRKFESSQKGESRAQLADSSNAYGKHRAFYYHISHSHNNCDFTDD